MSISKEAAQAVEAMNFYNLSDSEDEDGLPKPIKKKMPKRHDPNLDLIDEEYNEDDEAMMIQGGNLG